jgi:hypothetical protein
MHFNVIDDIDEYRNNHVTLHVWFLRFQYVLVLTAT